MASRTLLDTRDYDFSDGYLSAQVVVLPLDQKIDVTEYGCGELVFRLHGGTVPTNATMEIILVETAPTHADPGLRFQGITVGAVSFESFVTGPTLATGFVNFRTQYLAAYLVVLSPPSKVPFVVTVSAELVLKDDRALWTPASLGSKLTLWLDERAQEVTLGDVTKWKDQAGSAIEFTATAPNAPASALVNGAAAPLFAASSSDVMASVTTLSAVATASAYHGFAVVNPTTIVTTTDPDPSTNPQIICDGLLGGFWGLMVCSSGIAAWHNSGTPVATPFTIVTPNVRYLVEWSYDGTTLRCRVNTRTTQSISAGNIANLTHTLAMGHCWSGSGFFTGRIGAVLVCNQVLSNADAQAVRGYLSSKYGVPA